MNASNPDVFLFRLETFRGPVLSDVLEWRGTDCTVGRRAGVELRLPRADYPDVGPRELRLEWSGAGIAIFHLRPGLNQVSVDGVPVDGQVLLEGVHDVRINEHRLLLTLRPAYGGSGKRSLPDILQSVREATAVDPGLSPEAGNALASLVSALEASAAETPVSPAARRGVLEAYARAEALLPEYRTRSDGHRSAAILAAAADLLGMVPGPAEAPPPAGGSAPADEPRDTDEIRLRRSSPRPPRLKALDEWLRRGEVPDLEVLRAAAEEEFRRLSRSDESRPDAARLAIAAALLNDRAMYWRTLQAENERDERAARGERGDEAVEAAPGEPSSPAAVADRLWWYAEYHLQDLKSPLAERVLAKLAEFRAEPEGGEGNRGR